MAPASLGLVLLMTAMQSLGIPPQVLQQLGVDARLKDTLSMQAVIGIKDLASIALMNQNKKQTLQCIVEHLYLSQLQRCPCKLINR